MKAAALISVCVLHWSGMPAQAQTEDPADLVKLRTLYEGAVEKSLKPLTETYLAELEKMQDAYTKAAKLDEALRVAAEIKIARQRLGLSAEKPPVAAAATPAAAPPKTDGRVTIPANSPNGYPLGAVSRGDVIKLQYVEGMWKSHGGIATANPDDSDVDGGDDNRLVIARAPVNGAPGEIIKVVPSETRKKAFVYVFQTSREAVVLRIGANSDRTGNPGRVTYTLKVERLGR